MVCNSERFRYLYYTNIALLVLLPVLPVSIHWGIAAFVWTCFMVIGVVVTFHRFHTHGAFDFKSKMVERVFTMVGTLSGSGSILGWASIHRNHHRFADLPGDPHDPKYGLRKILMLKYPHKNWSNIKDLAKDKFLIHTHRYYFGYIGAYIALLFAFGGVGMVYSGFIFPSFFVVFVQALTNVLHHNPRVGYKNYKDNVAINLWWLNLLTFGDSWHNNHHQNPSARTTKERWWEFDPAGQVIKLVRA